MTEADMEKELSPKANKLAQAYINWFANLTELNDLEDIRIICECVEQSIQMVRERFNNH